MQLTFITLAMLVVGGSNSPWGATVGWALITSSTPIRRKPKRAPGSVLFSRTFPTA